MLTFYRLIKSGLTVGAFSLFAWYSANSLAQQAEQSAKPNSVTERNTYSPQKEPKLLSEMTAAEKAKLSKEDIKKLKAIEDKKMKLDAPKY